VVALLPIAFRPGQLAAAVHSRHIEGSCRTRCAQADRRSPSFAVDCLETLHEVAIEYAEEFLKSGGERLSLVPALNDDDRHAEVLVSVVRHRLGGWIS